MTKAGVSAPVVAQTSTRAPRVAAFTGFKPSKAAMIGKAAEASFSKAVSARVSTVQVCDSRLIWVQLATDLSPIAPTTTFISSIGIWMDHQKHFRQFSMAKFG